MSGRWIRPISHWLRYCNLRCWPYFTSSNMDVCFVAVVFNRVQTARPHAVLNTVPDGAQKHIQPVNILPAMKRWGCSSPTFSIASNTSSFTHVLTTNTCDEKCKVIEVCSSRSLLAYNPNWFIGLQTPQTADRIKLKKHNFPHYKISSLLATTVQGCGPIAPCSIFTVLHDLKRRMLSNIHSPHTIPLIPPVLMWFPLLNEAELSQGNTRHQTERCSLQLQYALM